MHVLKEGALQVCCPRPDARDSGAGAMALGAVHMHGIAQRRILMRNDFKV